MRTLPTIFACTILQMLISCRQDSAVRMGNQLEGQWKVKTILYNGGGLRPDSAFNPADTRLMIDTYQDANADGLFGIMRYQQGNDQIDFPIRLPHKNRLLVLPPGSLAGQKTVNLTGQEYKVLVKIGGIYEVTESGSNSFTIKCKECDQEESAGFVSREIRAVKF
jgi:hypothetical protein